MDNLNVLGKLLVTSLLHNSEEFPEVFVDIYNYISKEDFYIEDVVSSIKSCSYEDNMLSIIYYDSNRMESLYKSLPYNIRNDILLIYSRFISMLLTNTELYIWNHSDKCWHNKSPIMLQKKRKLSNTGIKEITVTPKGILFGNSACSHHHLYPNYGNTYTFVSKDINISLSHVTYVCIDNYDFYNNIISVQRHKGLYVPNKYKALIDCILYKGFIPDYVRNTSFKELQNLFSYEINNVIEMAKQYNIKESSIHKYLNERK